MTLESRVVALEKALQNLGPQTNARLLIGSNQGNPTPGALIAGLVPNATLRASQIHPLGSGQTIVGPGTGGGLGGGTEKTVDTVTWSVPGPLTVTFLLLAYYVAYVQVSAGPFSPGDTYFKVDGVTRTNMVGVMPTYGSPLPAYVDSRQCILLDFVTLAPGSHTIALIWDMFEGASDTLTTFADGLFVIQMGG